MKKILLFILLLFIGFSYGYSQYVPIQIVTEYDDPFLRHLPLNQMVYCKDSDAVYMLDIPAFPISKLSTTANHRVIGFTLDTTGFVMWTDTLVLIATKYDLDTLSNSIYDSLDTHNGLIQTWLQDTANLVHWSDTTTYIATKHDIDTLSNSVYDSLSNHYDLIHAFKPDSTSSGCFNNFYYKQITGCDVNNLYIKADTTKFSNYIKLPKFANNTTEPLLKVLPSGRIDTNQTRSIMGLHLDSLDVGEIDLTTLNVTNSNVTNENTTYSNVMVATNQSLILPNLGSNYEPVLSVADLSGTIDTTQVKSIYAIDFDSLKITNYVVIGGVPNVGYKFTLADDGIYSFANSSYGIGNLYCFNAGKKTAFTQYSFDIDGVVTFEISTTDEVVNAELDGYEICLYYSGGTYYIKNTSGGARNYILSIKYY